ncbi:MAG: imidazole glycerol phosphate synthase subunit HisH [Clostridia bacterium]|nr:imidazole glycerol phosphate synthase subunit HisH [Clostridia bacterium]
MIAIVDYGVGNLFSLKSSLQAVGAQVIVTGNAQDLRNADRIILPGVGAFGDAANKLREAGLAEIVKEEAVKGKPLMGICLGMQMLLEKSYEYGEHEGLGLIPGTIRPIAEAIPEGYKIPHIGWNALSFPEKKHPVFADIQEGDHVYFVHSFHGTDCEKYTAATTEYGGILTAAVAKDNVVGCQFHPEKSGSVGLTILKSFCNL